MPSVDCPDRCELSAHEQALSESFRRGEWTAPPPGAITPAMKATPESEKKLLSKLLSLPNQLPREGTSPEMVELFEKRVGLTLPSLFAALLQESNGGEWCFGRFEINPFVHPGIGDWSSAEVWEDLAEHSSLLNNPLVASGKVLPFCSDYGEGMYCFDYRVKTENPPVIFVSFGQVGDEYEEAAGSFVEFVQDSLDDEEKDSSRKTFTVDIPIPAERSIGEPVPVAELEGFGVVFEFIDNQALAEDEKKSSFSDEKRVRVYADPKRTVAFTMYDPTEPGPSYGVLQSGSELTPTEIKLMSGKAAEAESGVRYLGARALKKSGMVTFAVWHLSRTEPLTPENRIQITFSYLEK